MGRRTRNWGQHSTLHKLSSPEIFHYGFKTCFQLIHRPVILICFLYTVDCHRHGWSHRATFRGTHNRETWQSWNCTWIVIRHHQRKDVGYRTVPQLPSCDHLHPRRKQNGKWLSMLTHWGRDKMAAVFQTTFSNAFSWMKMHEFRLRFHRNLFPRVQLTKFQHWFR